MAQLERGRKSTRVGSHAFIQLKLASDVIGNHQLAGIRRTTEEDGERRRGESGKTLKPDAVLDAPREREPAGALCASREQCGEEAEEPEEALCLNKGRSVRGTGEPEEALYTNKVGVLGECGSQRRLSLWAETAVSSKRSCRAVW
ncbi:hypothetical protein Y1Q_0002817 [Alligator mississippiensis]|uniref:Uncharacterized protein n=1 Tax=Alligator mississippiensis TaxID=8496 RepID=A0A151NZ77_ALLMI|nr:hypothetical protein Y1Q_0002817 [Alligator mississippiensis]